MMMMVVEEEKLDGCGVRVKWLASVGVWGWERRRKREDVKLEEKRIAIDDVSVCVVFMYICVFFFASRLWQVIQLRSVLFKKKKE